MTKNTIFLRYKLPFSGSGSFFFPAYEAYRNIKLNIAMEK